MTRSDGGYFVRGNAILRGDAGREELVGVFTGPFLAEDPYMAHDLANQLNREAGLVEVDVPRRHGPTPYQRDMILVHCDGTPVRILRETGALAFPERYARRDRLRFARMLREWSRAVSA